MFVMYFKNNLKILRLFVLEKNFLAAEGDVQILLVDFQKLRIRSFLKILG